MISIKSFSRFKAAAIHLAASAAIAIATVAVMLTLWYPPPLFSAMGGIELIVLIVGVDVAIGPLITLIIFDTRKKELVFDLAVVAAMQLGALGYGGYAMHEGRPVFIAFVENHFAVVSAAELEDEALAKALPEFRSRPEAGPIVVAVDMPADPRELEAILFAGISGMGAQHLPQYYVPYAERRARVIAAAYPLDQLAKLSPEERAAMDKAIARLQRSPTDLRFLPMKAGHDALTALIDAETGQLLATVAVNPFGRGAGKSHATIAATFVKRQNHLDYLITRFGQKGLFMSNNVFAKNANTDCIRRAAICCWVC